MNLKIYALTLAIVALAVALGFQFYEIQSLKHQVAATRSLAQMASSDAQEALSENELQRDRLVALENSMKSDSQFARLPSPERLNSLLLGVFTLTTATPYSGGIPPSRPYEISHSVFRLGEWTLNVGVAWSEPEVFGFDVPIDVPFSAYFDYNGDGTNDLSLLLRFVREVPVLGTTLADKLLAQSATSQNLYSIFVAEWENADYTSAEDMTSGVAAGSTRVWNWIVDHSKAIESWIASI